MSEPSDSPSPDPPHEELRPDELLMRRFFLSKKHYRPAFTPPIQEGAFHPGKNDKDGLSLSRRRTELFTTFFDEWQFKAACTHPDDNLREHCGVCAVLVEAAHHLGLEVRPDPILPDDPGHVILPQITYTAFSEGTEELRGQIRIWISRLIELASDRILIAPGTPNRA